MYKVLYDNIVIDVLDEIKYARFLSKSGHTVITDATSANCIIASNNKDRYHIKGVPYPKGCKFKTVTLVQIDEDEYRKLLSQLNNSDSIVDNGIRLLKQKKIAEMSNACHDKIVNGIRIILSDNKIHHFELSLEDQVNLLEIKYMIDKGQQKFVYHETDGICKEYSLEDMQKIIDESFKHKQNNLLYFNSLKHYISTLNNIYDIIDLEYGVNIDR